MSEQIKQAEALVSIALETYAEEIVPELTSSKRYTGAMVANTLGIAKRRLSHPDPADALISSLGATSLMALARALRSGKISSTSNPELQDTLLNYLESELAITNPKFLERRKG